MPSKQTGLINAISNLCACIDSLASLKDEIYTGMPTSGEAKPAKPAIPVPFTSGMPLKALLEEAPQAIGELSETIRKIIEEIRSALF
jgi:hypothetical protein